MIEQIRPNEQDWLACDFLIQGSDHQFPPERSNAGEDWTTWLILGGRGAGKTRAGAEWVRSVAAEDEKARIALVGGTEHEVRDVRSRASRACWPCTATMRGRNGFPRAGA